MQQSQGNADGKGGPENGKPPVSSSNAGSKRLLEYLIFGDKPDESRPRESVLRIAEDGFPRVDTPSGGDC